MPTTATTTQSIAFDGPIHVGIVAVAGCALAWLIWWSLRREREVLGRRTAWLFGVLRAVALAVVLWMLLAPMAILAERTTTRQAIGIAVDTSSSMQTVDPPEAADDLRWSIATTGDVDDSLTAAADRALAAANIAARRLSAAIVALRNHQPERLALESAAGAHAAIDRARLKTQTVSERLQRLSNSEAVAAERERTARILKMLDGADFRRLAELAESFHDGQDSLSAGWRESLSDLEHQVSGVSRRLAELSRSVAAVDEADAKAAGAASHASRLERTANFLEAADRELFRPLHSTIDVRSATFQETVTPLAGQQSAAAELRQQTSKDAAPRPTDIAAVLEHLRRERSDQPLAAAFVLTDAAHNRADSRDPLEAAAELSGTPVYVVPIGSTRHVRDVDLKAVDVPGVVMKDDDVVIEVALQAFDCDAETCRVELLQEGSVVQDREIEIDSDIATHRVRFNTRLAELGLQRFQVRVVPLAGELSEENNLDQFEVNVTQSHIDILLADELPRWEYRYLAQLFRRDPKVQCDELLFRPRLIATGKREQSKAFPTAADDWDQYDVVLLGDVSAQQLSTPAQASLVEFVRERGGTLVMIAGDGHLPQAYVQQPLAELLPVTKVNNADAHDGYALSVTEDGWRHHALMIADSEASTRIAWDFINRNAPLYGLSPYRRAKPTARTLISAIPRASLEANPDPAQNVFLCWQPVGRGRVVYLAAPDTYRLRFLRGDRLHYRFWGQLLRWAIANDLAAGTGLVSIRTDRPDYRAGEEVQVVVRLNDETGKAVTDAAVEVAAITADDGPTTIPLRADESIPGRYLGTFERLPTGIYRVEPLGADVDRLVKAGGVEAESGAARASFTVRAPLSRELLDTRSDRALAQQIAAATGGQVLPPTAIGEVLALTDLTPRVSESTQSAPIWVEWKFLWIVFGCLFTEWAVRKKLGLS